MVRRHAACPNSLTPRSMPEQLEAMRHRRRARQGLDSAGMHKQVEVIQPAPRTLGSSARPWGNQQQRIRDKTAVGKAWASGAPAVKGRAALGHCVLLRRLPAVFMSAWPKEEVWLSGCQPAAPESTTACSAAPLHASRSELLERDLCSCSC
eukprot:363611-Chlamydomonas_euryale.AAC.16